MLKAEKWYIYGWCLMRGDFRLFKLSRMKEVIVAQDSFKPRNILLEQLPWDDEWQVSENMVELDLVFQKEMAGIVEEWFDGQMHTMDDGSIAVKTRLPAELRYGSGGNKTGAYTYHTGGDCRRDI